ncbi:hypothetical protein ADAWI_70 [Mycobacterium phage Adawi]|uniref:Uncharacterized protein n=1 Tax=Mycobacterium phage Adawi TaxID=1354507 RepID=T2A8R7_9CAUD|nr:hypothetical protein ADAWI_70 [Mycobacterium phage Adawi]AGU91983.1 hypothetical protein ADAWI_70 [Mycobacterium phage Adawi]
MTDVHVIDKRAQRAMDAQLTEHLRIARRNQIAANVRQLAGSLWWQGAAGGNPEAFDTRADLLAQARAEGLDV